MTSDSRPNPADPRSVRRTPDDEEPDEPEPIPLAALNGATLTWETPDGDTESVTFD